MPEAPSRSEIRKKFYEGESIVDWSIGAIFALRESIIDAIVKRSGERRFVMHVILIPSAFFDSRRQSIHDVRACSAQSAWLGPANARAATTACVQLA
jgi:hypothetical protein